MKKRYYLTEEELKELNSHFDSAYGHIRSAQNYLFYIHDRIYTAQNRYADRPKDKLFIAKMEDFRWAGD